MKQGRYLNFGCGGVFHREWVNVDIVPTSPEVMTCDLVGGLPFPDHTFEAVYSSHVLEHFEPATAANMLRECRRVLAPAGICRIVVPDLENQASAYLDKLRKARLNDPVTEGEYDWAVIEFIDQMVRTKPGGLMYEYLVSPDLPASEFVADRIGKSVLAQYRDLRHCAVSEPQAENRVTRQDRLSVRTVAEAIDRRLDDWAMQRVKSRIPHALREAMFRQTGEIHRWAYDKFSLTRALVRAGFVSVEALSYRTSEIPDFSSYQLDMNDAAEERRPHSIYMEGRA